MSRVTPLVEELAQLKEQVSKQSVPLGETRSVKRPPRFKVDRDKIMMIMQETVEDSEQSRQYLEALKASWNEILDSITPQYRALLLG